MWVERTYQVDLLANWSKPGLQTGMTGLKWQGSAASLWTQLDTRLGLNTASETNRCQFEDRRYSSEYSSSDQHYDSGDEEAEGNRQKRAIYQFATDLHIPRIIKKKKKKNLPH